MAALTRSGTFAAVSRLAVREILFTCASAVWPGMNRLERILAGR
jgi:hypothetical protein